MFILFKESKYLLRLGKVKTDGQYSSSIPTLLNFFGGGGAGSWGDCQLGNSEVGRAVN